MDGYSAPEMQIPYPNAVRFVNIPKSTLSLTSHVKKKFLQAQEDTYKKIPTWLGPGAKK